MCDMVRRYRARDELTLWCWRCGKEFPATRADAQTCGPRCRQAVSREFRDALYSPAIVLPFRFGPRAGRVSSVYAPENLTRLLQRGVRCL